MANIPTEDGVSYSVSIEITTAATVGNITINFGGVEILAAQTEVGKYGALVDAIGTTNEVVVLENASWNGTWINISVKRTHRLVTQWHPKTLVLEGLSEGNKPNTVAVRYTVPDDETGAWRDRSWSVLGSVAASGEPIVLTTMSLPGIFRTDEASNKAIAKLHRENRKTRASFVHSDEGVVLQPGDTVQLQSDLRGIDTPLWLEGNKFIDYGKHSIRGLIYRDAQFPDTAYDDEDEDITGTFVGINNYVTEVTDPPPECTPYACDALNYEQRKIAPATGSGQWDLLDYRDNPAQIPEFMRGGSGSFGGEQSGLQCTGHGGAWGSGDVTAVSLVPDLDLDVCDEWELAPACCKTTSTASAFYLVPTPDWGVKPANCNIACVVKGAWFDQAFKVRFWQGYAAMLGPYNQSANPFLIGDTHSVWFYRNESVDPQLDYLYFDYTRSSAYAAEIPLGILSSNIPALISVSVGVSAFTYEYGSYQGYFYDSWDAMRTVTFGWDIRRADGLTASGSQSVYHKLSQVWNPTGGGDLPEGLPDISKIKSYSAAGTDSNVFLSGSMENVYNLSAEFQFGGTSDGAIIQGSGGGSANSGLGVSFNRNFSAYEVPEDC